MTKLQLVSVNIALLAAMAACTASDPAPSSSPGSSGGSGDGGATDCTEVPTECSTTTELKNADVQGSKILPARTCYTVNEDLSVNSGTLTLEQGVVVQFATGKSIRVASGGQLQLGGTCEARVRLTSKDPASSWKGVRMNDSQGTNNTWSYAVLDYAGSDRWTGAAYSDAALFLEGSTTLQMDHVTVSRSKSHGLLAFDQVEFSFTNGTLEGNVTPAYLHPQVADRIGADLVLRDNTNPYLRVAFGNNDRVSGTRRWAALPFRIENRFFVAGDLTIDPGATLQFAQDTSLHVEAGGTLTAKGTTERPIKFAGAADTKGFWQGIQIKSGGIGTPATIGATFDHCEISDAGGTNWTGAPDSKASLFMNDASGAAITNTTFRNSAHYGLWAGEKARLPGFASNTFTGNARVMVVHPDRVGELGDGNALTSNDEDTVRVTFSNVDKLSTDATWKDQGVPYTVTNRFSVEAALAIDAGVVLRFSQDNGMIIDEKGSLTANGTAAKPVRFAGQNEVATGYWQGIQFQSNSPKNVLSHTTVAHAGAKGWNGGAQSDAAIFVADNASVSLSSVTLGPGGGYGIHLAGAGSAVSCSTVDFTNLVKGAVWKNSPAPGSVLANCP